MAEKEEGSACLSMTESRDDTAEHLSEAEASRERVTPQSKTEIVLLIRESAELRKSHNSCNGAGACGIIGTMSGRTEST